MVDMNTTSIQAVQKFPCSYQLVCASIQTFSHQIEIMLHITEIMTSNFFPSEQDSYLYCGKCIKNGRDKLFSQKKKKKLLELSYVQRTRLGGGVENPPENPTILHNFQQTANLSGISILIAKMPLAVLLIYGMSYSFHSSTPLSTSSSF